jgi:alkanesulfonate monooxygenase SsuD/methylene tetrahydromethanopterin reductase-like flavin-dependent oxidoreductase (luciferase family)
VPFVPVEFFTAQCERVRAACETIDRDPATMSFSIALVLCCGVDEHEVVRRAAAIGREPDELRMNGAAGTPEEVTSTLRAWADAGADRIYLQVLDLADLDHLDLVASDVAPHLA